MVNETYIVPADDLIKELAHQLKESELIKPPEWAWHVKTAVSRKKAPEDPDWWYVRTASVLRKVFFRGPIGVRRISRFYGGKRSYGSRRGHYQPGSENIVRTILQQLEKAQLIQKHKIKGRILSPNGLKYMNKIARSIKTSIPELAKY